MFSRSHSSLREVLGFSRLGKRASCGRQAGRQQSLAPSLLAVLAGPLSGLLLLHSANGSPVAASLAPTRRRRRLLLPLLRPPVRPSSVRPSISLRQFPKPSLMTTGGRRARPSPPSVPWLASSDSGLFYVTGKRDREATEHLKSGAWKRTRKGSG